MKLNGSGFSQLHALEMEESFYYLKVSQNKWHDHPAWTGCVYFIVAAKAPKGPPPFGRISALAKIIMPGMWKKKAQKNPS